MYAGSISLDGKTFLKVKVKEKHRFKSDMEHNLLVTKKTLKK